MTGSFIEKILLPFQRETSSGRYLPEIDGLRCLAVILVVAFHTHGFFTSGEEPSSLPKLITLPIGEALSFMPHLLISRGWFGVQIFFLISGLVLSLPYAAHYLCGEEKPLVRKYFRRRLIRIELPYFLALTFFFLLSAIVYGSGLAYLPNYLAGLIYGHGVIYDGSHNPLLFVAWTLEIEVQFYFLVPLICRVFALPKLGRRTLLILGIILVDYYLYGRLEGFTESIWHHTVLRQLNWFLPGLLLADLYLSPTLKGIRDEEGSFCFDLLGVIAWIGVFASLDFHHLIVPRPFILLLAFWCTLSGRVLRIIFRNRWITSTGVMCYTIYLFHNFFIHTIFGPYILGPVIGYQKGNWPWNAVIIAGMTVAIVIACGFVYLLVEKPFARGSLPRKKAAAKTSRSHKLDQGSSGYKGDSSESVN